MESKAWQGFSEHVSNRTTTQQYHSPPSLVKNILSYILISSASCQACSSAQKSSVSGPHRSAREVQWLHAVPRHSSKDVGDHLVGDCLGVMLPVGAILGGATHIVPEGPVCEEQGQEEDIEVGQRVREPSWQCPEESCQNLW